MIENSWLFVCEGTKTEPNYINNLIKRINQIAKPERKINAVIKGKGKNTISLVNTMDLFMDYVDEEYDKMHIPYSNIGVIFDKDSFGKEQFNTAIQKTKAMEKRLVLGGRVIPAWSNESFELWLNLHFSYIPTNLNRNALNNALTKKFGSTGVIGKRETYERYGKSRLNLFDDIKRSGGSLTVAIKNSKRLAEEYDGEDYANHSPCTNVYELVLSSP